MQMPPVWWYLRVVFREYVASTGAACDLRGKFTGVEGFGCRVGFEVMLTPFVRCLRGRQGMTGSNGGRCPERH